MKKIEKIQLTLDYFSAPHTSGVISGENWYFLSEILVNKGIEIEEADLSSAFMPSLYYVPYDSTPLSDDQIKSILRSSYLILIVSEDDIFSISKKFSLPIFLVDNLIKSVYKTIFNYEVNPNAPWGSFSNYQSVSNNPYAWLRFVVGIISGKYSKRFISKAFPGLHPYYDLFKSSTFILPLVVFYYLRLLLSPSEHQLFLSVFHICDVIGISNYLDVYNSIVFSGGTND